MDLNEHEPVQIYDCLPKCLVCPVTEIDKISIHCNKSDKYSVKQSTATIWRFMEDTKLQRNFKIFIFKVIRNFKIASSSKLNSQKVYLILYPHRTTQRLLYVHTKLNTHNQVSIN